ncbi:class F sortase [Spirillospora sp. NPDC052242]
MLLAAVAAVLLLSACGGGGSAPAARTTPAPPTAPAPSTSTPSPAAAGDASGEAADPVRVRVPSIGVSAAMVPLAIDRSGTLAAPKGYDVAGWNVAGPEPGERGTAVIAGHVDSRTGPAVFYRLRDLRPGDAVEVDRKDGSTARFEVTRLERHSKSGVPDSVYEPAPGPEVRLITCGGAFDRDRGGYRDNIIVYAAAA